MTHRCPACGAPIAPSSVTCTACKSGVNWTDGRPAVAFNSHLIRPEWPSGLVVAILAALSLAAVWTVIWFAG